MYNLNLDRVLRTAKMTKDFLDDNVRKLSGQGWLPLSVREHFSRDVPELIKEVRELRTEVEKLTPVVDAAKAYTSYYGESIRRYTSDNSEQHDVRELLVIAVDNYQGGSTKISYNIFD